MLSSSVGPVMLVKGMGHFLITRNMQNAVKGGRAGT